jgi:formamidase
MTSATKPLPNQTSSQLISGSAEVRVNEYTNGVLDPSLPMLGPVADGGHILAETAPDAGGR